MLVLSRKFCLPNGDIYETWEVFRRYASFENASEHASNTKAEPCRWNCLNIFGSYIHTRYDEHKVWFKLEQQ